MPRRILSPLDAESYLMRMFGSKQGASTEPRKAPRYLTSDHALVFLPGSLRPTVSVIVEDVSKTGLGMSSAEPLPEGNRVRIIMRTLTALGRIQWCHVNDGNYKAGVAIENIIKFKSTRDGS